MEGLAVLPGTTALGEAAPAALPAAAWSDTPRSDAIGPGGAIPPSSAARPTLAHLIAREVPAVAIMMWVVVVGHSGVALLASALVLVLLSMTYAPAARTRSWAREHVLDLWAMALLMLAMLASTATVSGAGTEAAHSGEHGHQILLSLGGLSISVVAAWTAVRLWMLVRTGFQRHSVISALVCGGGLAWMLLL